MRRGKFNSDIQLRTILVFDYDRNFSALIEKALISLDNPILYLSTAKELIAYISTNYNVFILLDPNLPDHSGMELLNHLQQASVNIPFIVMTCLDDDQLAGEVMKQGGLGYYIKNKSLLTTLPFVLKNVFQQIENECLLIRAENNLKICNSFPSVVNEFSPESGPLSDREIRNEVSAQTEHFYRHIFETSSNALFIREFETEEIIRMNETLPFMFGYGSEAELMKCSPEDLSAVNEGFDHIRFSNEIQIGKKEGSHSFEWLAKKKAGQLFWVNITVRILKLGIEQKLLFKIRDINSQKQSEDILFKLATDFAHLTGKTFFEAISELAAKMLEMDIVFVGKLEANGEIIQTLGGNIRGTRMELKRYFVAGSPCGKVVANKSIFYSGSVQDEFPQSELLIRIGIKSYVGVPIFRNDGEILGILVAMDSKSPLDIGTINQIFSVFLERVSAELERYEAEASLLEARSLLDKSLQVSHIGSIIANLLTGHLTLSEEACKILEIEADSEYSLKRLAECIHQDDQKETIQAYESFLRENKDTLEIECRINSSLSGQIRNVKVLLVRENDAKGNALRLIGIVQDITESKIIKERVRLLSQAVEQSPVSVVITNLNGIIEYVNPKFTQLTGYSFEEVIGKNPRILKSGEMKGDYYNELWSTILAGNDWRGEFHNKKKNEELFWEMANISPIKDDKGNIIKYVAIKEDVTEQKRVEKALEKRIIALTKPLVKNDRIAINDLFYIDDLQKLQDEFSNAVNVASIITMPDGTPITKPSNFTRLCGQIIRRTEKGLSKCYQSDALLGMPNAVGPNIQPCLSCGLWDAGSSITVDGQHVATWLVGQVRDNEQTEEDVRRCACEMGVGEELFLEAYREVPYMNRDQFAKIAQVLFTIANQLSNAAYQNVQQARFIYERKQAEAELIIAKEKAEESNRLKTHFLANISHEIRTPMNGILGFLSLLNEMSISNEEREEYLSIVQKSGQRLLETINDIIEMSRIESGTTQNEITDVNLKLMMHDISNFYRPLFTAKGLTYDFQVQSDRDPIIIRTDKRKLEVILTNLLKNAMKFTPSGGLIFGLIQDLNSLTFYVKDTGIGIPADRIEAIFDRFVQGDLRMTRAYEGMGLGLPIARANAQMLGGNVRVESTPGNGSTFYLTIPFEAGSYSPQELKNDKISEIGQFHDFTVLVAEDDQTSYDYLEILLKKLGAKIIRVTTGDKAIEVINENRDVSMILMDLKMPGMNGIEATREIRKLNVEIPIIAQTAYAFVGDKEMALEAGCNDYIAKPINKERMLGIIRKYTKNS